MYMMYNLFISCWEKVFAVYFCNTHSARKQMQGIFFSSFCFCFSNLESIDSWFLLLFFCLDFLLSSWFAGLQYIVRTWWHGCYHYAFHYFSFCHAFCSCQFMQRNLKNVLCIFLSAVCNTNQKKCQTSG